MFTEILRFNQVLSTKNANGKRRLTSSNRDAMSAPHAKNDTKSLVGFCAIKLASKQKVTKF